MMHPDLGGYKVSDIKTVVAFDVDARKVGKDLSEAIWWRLKLSFWDSDVE